MRISALLRSWALLLILLIVGDPFSYASKPVDPAAMKAKVLARGMGQGVRVTLANQTSAKGVIVNIGDQSFTVTPKGSTVPQEIEYAQVTGVHKDKMGTGTKVIIVVAVAGAAVGISAAVLVHDFHKSFNNLDFCPNNQCTLVSETGLPQ